MSENTTKAPVLIEDETITIPNITQILKQFVESKTQTEELPKSATERLRQIEQKEIFPPD